MTSFQPKPFKREVVKLQWWDGENNEAERKMGTSVCVGGEAEEANYIIMQII